VRLRRVSASIFQPKPSESKSLNLVSLKGVPTDVFPADLLAFQFAGAPQRLATVGMDGLLSSRSSAVTRMRL
jgi:hypothetical protein